MDLHIKGIFSYKIVEINLHLTCFVLPFHDAAELFPGEAIYRKSLQLKSMLTSHLWYFFLFLWFQVCRNICQSRNILFRLYLFWIQKVFVTNILISYFLEQKFISWILFNWFSLYGQLYSFELYTRLVVTAPHKHLL